MRVFTLLNKLLGNWKDITSTLLEQTDVYTTEKVQYKTNNSSIYYISSMNPYYSSLLIHTSNRGQSLRFAKK